MSKRKHKEDQPKTLILDIETAPVLGNVWGMWKQNLGLEMIEKDWYILSFSAKWLGSSNRDIHYFDQKDADDIEDDRLILEALWVLLDEADVVVAHNGRRFDVPKINTRFLTNKMEVPSPYRVVDTLDIVKRNFKFTSNKLEYLTEILCKKKKLKHQKFPGFSLWKECMNGNEKAWEEMKRYNIRDVVSLEELYLYLRPWNKSQPNSGAYSNKHDMCCSKCGSNRLVSRGYYYTQVGKYQRFKCKDCGGWSRDRKSHKTKEQREFMLTSI